MTGDQMGIRRRVLNAVVAGIAGVVVIGSSSNLEAQFGGPIFRLTADFRHFDATETSSDFYSSPPSDGGNGGHLLFQKTLVVPEDTNTVYVTLSATADTHNGAALWLSCVMDGVACNPGLVHSALVEVPCCFTRSGWVPVQKHLNWEGFPDKPILGDGGGGGGDVHDNVVHYTWCIARGRTDAAPTTIQVRIASSGYDDEAGQNFSGPNTAPSVHVAAAHLFIDASNITQGSACTPWP